MRTETSNVFLALQANDDTRPIVEAILADNPNAKVDDQPGMVRIYAPNTLSVNRETVEELVGRSFDLQELHIHMISISGHVDETDDTLTLTWNH
jgi:phenol/toluene 2-monooxygenase (NADH) P2/A2